MRSLKIILLLFIPYILSAQDVQMRIINKDGTLMSFPITEIRKITFTGINGITPFEIPKIVSNLLVISNYPNPFTQSTNIKYTLNERGNVAAYILDMNGRLVCNLLNEPQGEGEQTVTWDGSNVNGHSAEPGMYVCIIKFNNQVFSKKIIFIQ